ncbi:MAG: acyl--CoA ligase [Myxococcales bacterium]|nr:acyl--CoA ligase [Myxococcales bacterium]
MACPPTWKDTIAGFLARSWHEARLLRGRDVDLGTLPAVLAGAYGDRPAIVAETPAPGLPPRRLWSYRDLEDDTARLAAAHDALGHTSGARVALLLGNRVDLLLHVLALVRAGGVPVLLHPRLRPLEITEAVRASRASFGIADPQVLASPVAVDDASGALRWRSSGASGEPIASAPRAIRPEADLAAWLHAHPRARLGPTGRIGRHEAGLLLCTSGTTGRPKVAALTSEGLLRGFRPLVIAPIGRPHGLRAGRDALLCALPLTHVMGVVTLLGALCAGVKIIHHESFQAGEILAAIERERPNIFVGVPTMYADLEAEDADRRDLSSVQLWISAADVMPAARARRFQGRGAAVRTRGRTYGTALFADVYGMVELSGAAAVRVYPPCPWRGLRVPALACVLPGFEARTVDVSGRVRRWGASGELQMRGPAVLRGYQGAPGEERRPEEWFATGDFARLWPGGVFQFLGRRGDRLKVGGFSVFPAEVEAHLRAHPDVADLAVVGVPDARRGDELVALVVPRRVPFDPVAFLAWSAERVAGYRRPRTAIVVDALPRGRHGKIDRAAATRIARERRGTGSEVT